MSYAVCRTDNLQGTSDGSKLVTLRYYDGSAYAAIDNGRIVKLDTLYSTSYKDIWKAIKPTANDVASNGKLVLVAGVELMYSELKHNFDEFQNAVDADIRGYVLQSGDVFSVTADAFTSAAVPDLTTNKYITLPATSYMTRGSSDSNVFADLIAIEAEGGYTYYVLRVR